MAPKRRRQVVDRLADLAEDNVELNFDEVFLSGLEDSDADLRLICVHALWEHEGRGFIAVLVELMRSDADTRVKAEAALSLGRYVIKAEFDELRPVDASVIGEALRDVIANTAEAVEVRARALESLGARSLPWVTPIIQAAYDGPDRRLRLSAVHAMGRSCDTYWLSTLIEELSSDDAEMRFEAAGACGSLAEEESVPRLLPLLDDEDFEVQEAAVKALGEIGGREAKEALEECLQRSDPRIQEACVAALAELAFEEDPLAFESRG
jgi:HEAT repeat protein